MQRVVELTLPVDVAERQQAPHHMLRGINIHPVVSED